MIANYKRKRKKPFSVLDIETAKNGDILAGSLYDGKKIFDFFTWDEFLEFLKENQNKKRFQNIFAHNGGGFDWISFIESQMENLDQMKIISSGSGIVFIQLLDFKKPIMLCDSILTLLRGLNALCEKFEPSTPKLKDIDIERIEEIFNDEPETFWKYLHNDVISLYEIMTQFQELIEIDFFPLTAASLSMYIFRERYLPPDVKLLKADFVQSYKMNDERVYVESQSKKWKQIDEFITRSYAGGRVECFRPGIFENVNSFDINSLYPYVMTKAEIPTCLPVQVFNYHPGKVGFYEISFKQHNRKLPPVLWKKSKRYGLEFVYEGEGVFSSVEIENALRIGTDIEFKSGYIYPRTQKIFVDFVNDLYELRNKNRDNPLEYICKIILNSLYGKWAQKEESDHLEKIGPDELQERIKGGEKITVYDAEKGLYSVGEDREIDHRLIHVASIITAHARTELFKYIEMFPDTVIYCDTDSIHIQNELPSEMMGNELGQMKKEESGHGVYLGRKQYAISNKIKFKGITLKNKLCPDDFAQIITPATLEKIWEGEPINFTFHTFPKFKSVLRGKKACKIIPITKSMKRGEYTTNFLGNKC